MIATQNPSNQIGTFPLPESQLDRFMMRLHLGYPDNHAERELLKGRDRREMLTEIQAVISPDQLIVLQNQTPGVTVSDAILDYLQDILEYSRVSPDFNGAYHRARALRCCDVHRPGHYWTIDPMSFLKTYSRFYPALSLTDYTRQTKNIAIHLTWCQIS